MSISAPFIHRPVGTTLLTVAIALGGALGYFLLPVSPLPQVEFPTISVSAQLPGASPETMASAVATPLERQFGRIAGITQMTSSSTIGGTSVTMQFDLNRDINAAARDVQAAINAAAGQLPTNLPGRPTYRKYNPADAPVLILALTSDLYDRAHMYDVAASILQQKLSQVPGIGQVIIGGSALPAVRVDVNPTALNNLGLGLSDVRTVLGSANANRPKGQIADSRRTYSLGTTDQLLTAKEYEPLIIAYRNGAPVRLSSVANVIDSVEDVRVTGLANGTPAVPLIIFRQPGANIISAVDNVMAILPQLRAEIPPAMNLLVISDRTTTIRASVEDTQYSLMLSIGLVVLVVFLFLRDPRSTLIPAVAVPVSLIGTFGVMYLCGYSKDKLSLMALTIATGFVVDDAIVVVENISRYLEKGFSPLEAALRGAKEVGFTVVSISVSLIAVFIPILLMSGYIGRLFREFAVTLSVAIVMSMVVSLTLTPMMCAVLLKPHDAARHHGRIYNLSERFFDSIHGFYEWSLAHVLRHPLITIIVLGATVALNVYLFYIVPSSLFPQQDTGRLSGNIVADQDTSYQTMARLLSAFAAVVKDDPAVADFVGFTGGSRGGGTTVNTARMFISLKPLGERKMTVDEVIGRLRGKLARIPGATLYMQAQQDLNVGGRSGNAQYQFTLQGDDLKELTDWSPRVLAAMTKLPGVLDVNSDQQNKGLSASLNIDRDAAARLGLNTKLIDDALYDAFGQRQVSTMYTALNQYHVVMEVTSDLAKNPDALHHVYVRPPKGKPVPLDSVVKYTPSAAPLAVNHQSQFPAVTLSFNLKPGKSLGSAEEDIQQACREIGLPISIHGEFAGTAQVFQASKESEPYLIAAAVVAVYLVLGMLYESLIHPITILSTLPSAGVGAILALLLCHTDLTIIATIGIILLIGIVKKNAIMMIDFALAAERNEGKSPRDAIYQACLLRFRPITMTTMAALLGGLPLALGTGVGSELRKPLGIAIVGGLIFSQALTLYTTPVVYLYLDRFRLWLRESFGTHRQTAQPEGSAA
ncbi:multidrug efflux RND transporter permease subunit MuxC [soil metagenome]